MSNDSVSANSDDPLYFPHPDGSGEWGVLTWGDANAMPIYKDDDELATMEMVQAALKYVRPRLTVTASTIPILEVNTA